MLVFDKGDDILIGLSDFVKKNEIKGGQLSGIGVLTQVELGFYHLDKKLYERKHFGSKEFELLSFNGNISLREDEPFVHVHVSLGQENFQVIGGHLFSAKVGVTAEIFLHPLGVMPIRKQNEEIGLALIDSI